MVAAAAGGAARRRIPPDEAANAAAAHPPAPAAECHGVQQLPASRTLPRRSVAGSKPKPANDSPRTWTAAAGTLKAVGSNDGKSVATYELRPAGPVAKIALATDFGANLPHDFDDVAALQVTITDAAGNPVVSATPEVQFAITGPGAIAAIDNGALDNHESFQGHQVRAAGGQCTAYIRATADSGTITVTATADGLAAGAVTLNAQPPKKK